MTVSLKQKQDVLRQAKSTISVEPFSCLAEPKTEEEAKNQFLELLKACDVHPPGVMPQPAPQVDFSAPSKAPQLGGSSGFGIPGQSDVIWSDS